MVLSERADRFAGQDDIIGLFLIDLGVFAETYPHGKRTRKMRGSQRELRIPGADVLAVRALISELREGKLSTTEATQRFLKIPSVDTYKNKTLDEASFFERHVKRYIDALVPDSGVAFHQTDRYTTALKSAAKRQTPSPTPPPGTSKSSDVIELGVYATRSFKKGEEIKLKGNLVELSDEQDDDLRAFARDFSVLYSSRRQCFNLLLGPARFVNHDCRNNVEFNHNGLNLTFKVVEDIEQDEEIFTHYSANYFDDANKSCLCATCERHKRGAFAPEVKQKPLPKAKKPVPPPKRASSPSRRSSRGHELTAQRSIASASGSRSRSSSLSSLSSARSSSTLSSLSSSGSSSRASSVERRRSIRTVVVVDELRVGKRLVHPRMRPPPAYSHQYQWDEKKRVAKYIGPTASTAVSRPSLSNVPSSSVQLSKVALGKRKREETDSEDESDPGERKPRKPRGPPKPKKVYRLGVRSSTRNPNVGFERLEAAGLMGDSDLTDLDDSAVDTNESESGAESDEQEAIEEDDQGEDGDIDDDEETPLHPLRISPELRLPSTEATPPVTSSSRARLKGNSRTPAQHVTAFRYRSTPRRMSSACSPILSTSHSFEDEDVPPDNDLQDSGEGAPNGGGSRNGGEDNVKEEEDTSNNGAGKDGEVPNGQSFRGEGAGEDNGDEEGDRRPKAPTKVGSSVEAEVVAMEEEEENEGGAAEPSEGGDFGLDGREDTERDAIATLMMLFNNSPIPAPHSPSADPGPSFVSTNGGSSADQQTLGAPFAESPPSKSRKRSRRATNEMADIGSSDQQPESSSRLTRRQSRQHSNLADLSITGESVPTPPASSGPSRPRSANDAIRDDSPAGASPRARSKARQRASFGEMGEVRGTRSSRPIPGKLDDLLASPDVAKITGKYDYANKRYLSSRAAGRLPEDVPSPQGSPELGEGHSTTSTELSSLQSTTLPTPSTSNAGSPAPVAAPNSSKTSSETNSPATEGRSTRGRRPIEGDIRSLLASGAVLGVTGGYDPDVGKYLSRKAASTRTAV